MRHVRRALGWLTGNDPVVGAGMALLCLYYVATRGVFQGKLSGDGFFGFGYLRAIIFEHTLDMQKVLPQWKPYFGITAATGHMPNRCPFGPALAWLPFYLVGCGLAWLGKVLHLFRELSPDSPFHAWMAGLGSLAATLVGYRHVFRLCDRRLGRNAARLGATVAVWATPIAWYTVTQPLYQHACAFGAVALLVDEWDRTRGSVEARRYLWLGCIGGVAMMMRPQEALFLLLPGGEALYRLGRGPDRRRALVGGLVLVAATVITFFPQVLVWRYYTGSFKPPQWEPIRWDHPLLVTTLFSTRSGLFPWSPIAYAAALGLCVARRARLVAYALLAIFLVDLYICAGAWVPSAAYSYGARRLSDVAPLLGLGTALLYQCFQSLRARRVVVGFAALCVALCLFTMEMQRAHHVPSSGGYARTAELYLEQVGAPRWLQRAFDTVGYPFVQPAGWIFALYHHVPVSTFEGVVGNFQLDRDGQWFTLLPEGKTLWLNRDHRSSVASGLDFPSDNKQPATVTGPLRILVSMFANEKIFAKVLGQIEPGAISATWNGVSVSVTRVPDGVTFEVFKPSVKVELNELRLDLPVGSRLRQIDFSPR